MSYPNIRTLLPSMRILLYAGSGFVLIAGIQLLVFADQTEILFAWTIKPPLTAAVLGAFYFGSMCYSFLSARGQVWAYTRGGVPGVIFFTWLTLAATLLHLDRFHFNSANPFTLTVTYTWLVIYALEPTALVVLLYLQSRAPGSDPARAAVLPGGFRAILFIQGILFLFFASALFIAPQTMIPLWGWALTPLTARALAAWIFSLGIVSVRAAWENDWTRIRISMISYAILGALQFFALGLYARDMDWSAPSGWAFTALIASILGVGTYGWFKARRAVSG